MKVVATILAVESRRKFAEALRDEVAHHVPVQLSCKDSVSDLDDAFMRSKELLQFATLQNADWHLYLEDDQSLTREFWQVLPRICMEDKVDLWYLANRSIPIGELGRLAGMRVNRICQPVAGSHGLLYRTKHIPNLLLDFECRPVDHWFWNNIDPHKHLLYQILSPVCAVHLGKESTLHSYQENEHLNHQTPGM